MFGSVSVFLLEYSSNVRARPSSKDLFKNGTKLLGRLSSVDREVAHRGWYVLQAVSTVVGGHCLRCGWVS